MNVSTTDRTIAIMLDKDEAWSLLNLLDIGYIAAPVAVAQIPNPMVHSLRDDLARFVGEED